MHRLAPSVLLLASVLGTACSETELRTVYSPPVLYEQPDALGPTLWSDEFQQRTVDASDILFVVDDSCSMQGEQAELASNFDSFIQSFAGTDLDYHIGVVRAALDEGQQNQWGILEQLPDGSRWINADTSDAVGAFNSIANVGTNGGNCEMGLQASFSALGYQSDTGRPNEGFYREDALLTLVVISDEIDHGTDWSPFGGCNGISPQEYIPWFLNDLKGPNNQDDLIFTGIVGDRPNGCEVGDNGADPGDGYWDVIDAVDGNFLSICSDDWSVFLTELGYEAAGLKRSFNLRRVPVQSSLVLTVDDIEPDPSTWSYNRLTNSIDFPLDHIPDELAVVRARYELLEDTGADAPLEDAGDE